MRIRVAGYVKLAKLWERNREQAIAYHHKYYSELFIGNDEYELVDVYIDITGQKSIVKRPEMVRQLCDCADGKIDLIVAQTKGYFAANTAEFCYFVKYLFDLNHRIDLYTEDTDYHIDMILDLEDQRRELSQMVDKYTELNNADYNKWLESLKKAISKTLQEAEK